MQKEDVHTLMGEHPLLGVCFALALRFEFVGGVLGSGIGSPTEQTWVSNSELKGPGRSVGSMSIEVQCALLTLAFLQPTPRMRDVDRKPCKQGGNVRLRHDGYRLSE